jgi:hypothetical protein
MVAQFLRNAIVGARDSGCPPHSAGLGPNAAVPLPHVESGEVSPSDTKTIVSDFGAKQCLNVLCWSYAALR